MKVRIVQGLKLQIANLGISNMLELGTIQRSASKDITEEILKLKFEITKASNLKLILTH